MAASLEYEVSSSQTRLVTDSNGNVVKRYDFLPFGEEAWGGSAGWGGRTSCGSPKLHQEPF